MKTHIFMGLAAFGMALVLVYAACNNHTHDWVWTIDAVAATCTSSSKDTAVCSECGAVTDKAGSVAALGHTDGAAATCTTAQTCMVCSEILAAALGHEYDWVVTNDTSYPAISTGTCSRDGHTETRGTAIGDKGPGGGKIFYVGTFTMTDNSSTAHYLEAAPSNQGTGIRWATATASPYATVSTDANATVIGSGRRNTALIIAGDPYSTYNHAALLCKNYINNGKNDWFLPSFDELSEIYNNLVNGKPDHGYEMGTGTASSYWSSSQYSVDTARYRQFSSGAVSSGHKYQSQPVRAIRAF